MTHMAKYAYSADLAFRYLHLLAVVGSTGSFEGILCRSITNGKPIREPSSPYHVSEVDFPGYWMHHSSLSDYNYVLLLAILTQTIVNPTSPSLTATRWPRWWRAITKGWSVTTSN